MSSRARGAVTLVLVAAVLGLGLAIAVHHDPAAGADRSTLRWVLDHRTPWVTHLATALSDVFSPTWVAVAAVVVAVVLIRRDRRLDRGARVLGVVAIAGALAEVLKVAVDRLRPPEMDQVGSPEAAMSFPSGHVTGTCALVLGLAVIVTARRRARVIAVAVAAVVSVAVGASRLYLGAHWLTDVVASVAVAVAAVLAAPLLVDAILTAIRPHLPVRLRTMVGGSTPAGATR
ncbi:phosphatase PAP2 family protein [Williamsia deligens]|uniref:Phosphatase PAP2 family protein n=1 Tax=Williamsia deligens TaxID=321325 RepID=A0ABW3G7N5_9NOCA|nr:phosphatase PAP2 family protein [Williamsia deligens]MCP2193584.1 undecaprenyl-diphosphatase [Williamsia deligens]